jgi:hypothetical protein
MAGKALSHLAAAGVAGAEKKNFQFALLMHHPQTSL